MVNFDISNIFLDLSAHGLCPLNRNIGTVDVSGCLVFEVLETGVARFLDFVRFNGT